MGKVVIFGSIISLLLVILILELVRRRRLLEEYSLLWLLVGVLMFILIFWKSLHVRLAKAIGIFYPPSALFLFGLLFVIVLTLHFSTVVSRLTQQNRELAQKIALLENSVGERKRETK